MGEPEKDKKMVRELHSKMGHPVQGDFARMLRLGTTRSVEARAEGVQL